MTGAGRLAYLLRAVRRQLAAAVLLGAAAVGAGVGLMGTAAYLIAAAALQPSIAELQVAIVGVRFFGLSRAVFRYLERLVSHGVALRLLGRLRCWFFGALEPLAPARTLELGSADLLARAVSDVESLQELGVRGAAPPLVAAAVGVGAAGLLAVHDPLLAAAFAVSYLAAAAVLPVGVLWLGRAAGGRLAEIRGTLATAIADGLQGMPDLLVFGAAERHRQRIDELSRRAATAREHGARVEAMGAAGVTFAAHGTAWLVLVLAIPMVGDGRLAGIDLGVVALVAMAAFEAVQPLPAAARALAQQAAAARRVFAVVDARPAVAEAAGAAPLEPRTLIRPGRPLLEVAGVGLTYPNGVRPALAGVDLTLAPGQRVGVVGPSGSGKSTLAHLLVRFWDPDAGSIRLAGRDISTLPLEDLRSIVGLLPQRVDLFAGTIRDNLLIAAPDAEEDVLASAAESAGLLAEIRAFPDGWETWIGEHGLQLSGGQRQRLGIARLLLRRPAVVVLDEPTSGLDPVTEGRVLQSMTEALGDSAMVLVSHRLVAMAELGEILVLDGGRAVERGRHHELMARNGLYRRLYDAQGLELGSGADASSLEPDQDRG